MSEPTWRRLPASRDPDTEALVRQVEGQFARTAEAIALAFDSRQAGHNGFPARCRSIAKQRLEEAAMWMQRGLEAL